MLELHNSVDAVKASLNTAKYSIFDKEIDRNLELALASLQRLQEQLPCQTSDAHQETPNNDFCDSFLKSQINRLLAENNRQWSIIEQQSTQISDLTVQFNNQRTYFTNQLQACAFASRSYVNQCGTLARKESSDQQAYCAELQATVDHLQSNNSNQQRQMAEMTQSSQLLHEQLTQQNLQLQELSVTRSQLSESRQHSEEHVELIAQLSDRVRQLEGDNQALKQQIAQLSAQNVESTARAAIYKEQAQNTQKCITHAQNALNDVQILKSELKSLNLHELAQNTQQRSNDALNSISNAFQLQLQRYRQKQAEIMRIKGQLTHHQALITAAQRSADEQAAIARATQNECLQARSAQAASEQACATQEQRLQALGARYEALNARLEQLRAQNMLNSSNAQAASQLATQAQNLNSQSIQMPQSQGQLLNTQASQAQILQSQALQEQKEKLVKQFTAQLSELRELAEKRQNEQISINQRIVEENEQIRSKYDELRASTVK